jgi:hypothetical protein
MAPIICGGYDIPMGKLAPVPHKDGEDVSKEIYLVSNFGTNQDLRIELYYNDADSTKAIMGVDRSVVIKSGASLTGDMGTPYLYVASEDSSGVVTFYDYNSATSKMDRITLQGLKRRVDGTAKFPCPGQGAFGVSLVLMLGSLTLCLLEIQMSGRALDLQLRDVKCRER